MPRTTDAAALAKVRAQQVAEEAKVQQARQAVDRRKAEARALEHRIRLAREAEVGALAGKAGLVGEEDTTLAQGFLLLRHLLLRGQLLTALAALDVQDGWARSEGETLMATHSPGEQ